MRKLFVFLGVALTAIGSAVRAQEVDSIAPLQMSSWGDAKESEIADYIPEISLDSRFGYSHDFSEDFGRFGGNGLFLDINGKITPNLYYSLNHRIANFDGGDGLGFDNTNWLTLTYENDYFFVTAGKEDVKVGSFEYDAYDLDCYWEMNSQFWNNVSPWQWGLSAGWYPVEGQTILAQACNSPFSTVAIGNLFAYALGWKGEWDFYESYWTANLWQYDKGKYVKALNLGNRFYAGDFTFDLDFATRCRSFRDAFSRDLTLAFVPSYEWDWGRAFVKVGWERVSEATYACPLENWEEDMFNGDNIFYGAGAEFFPFKSYKDVRLHAIWASNSHLTGGHYLNIGLTWKFSLTDAGKYLFNKLKK